VRTVNVTGGAAEYVWLRDTETTGQDITTDEVQLALVDPRTVPPVYAWEAPILTEHPSPPVVRAALWVDAARPLGVYQAYIRLTDDPEILPRLAGWVRIT
jgi:hypothetical protein